MLEKQLLLDTVAVLGNFLWRHGGTDKRAALTSLLPRLNRRITCVWVDVTSDPPYVAATIPMLERIVYRDGERIEVLPARVLVSIKEVSPTAAVFYPTLTNVYGETHTPFVMTSAGKIP